MKSFIKFGAVLTFAASVLFSCKKSGEIIYTEPTCALANVHEETTKATIINKWKIVTDSTFMRISADNHPLNYVGQSDDYFDFRNDGKLYIKEGLKLDTSVYKLASDTTVSILPIAGILNNTAFHIRNLTSKTVIINTDIAVTPGGLFGRKITLIK